MNDSSVSNSKVGAHIDLRFPWEHRGSAIVDADGKWVETIASKEIRRRIVACVNACAGIPTEALEQSRAVLMDSMDNAVAQRDELAEALRAACPDGIEENCDECAPGPCAGCWVINARAALAKLDTDSTK